MTMLARMSCFALVVGTAFGQTAGTGRALAETEEAKLTASDAAERDWFGESVSVSGDLALIGANGNDDAGPDSGSAYVYRYDPSSGEWIEEAKLTASDTAPADLFGGSVSVSGDLAVIGAFGDDDAGGESGSAYVYRYDPSSGDWIEEAKLTASDGAAGDNFGFSVSVSGDLAVIGAKKDDDAGS
jgi:N-acetylneuraminic acid mutarotase